DVDTTSNGRADRARPVLLDPLQLELGDQGQDPNREAAHRGRAVEVVLDRDEPGAGLVQAANRLERVDRRAGEAVEPRHHDSAGLAPLAARERLLELGSLELRTRLVELFPPVDDLDLVQLRPVRDLLALYLRGDERLAFTAGTAADADVTIGRAAPPSHAPTRRLEDRWGQSTTSRSAPASPAR